MTETHTQDKEHRKLGVGEWASQVGLASAVGTGLAVGLPEAVDGFNSLTGLGEMGGNPVVLKYLGIIGDKVLDYAGKAALYTVAAGGPFTIGAGIWNSARKGIYNAFTRKHNRNQAELVQSESDSKR